MYNEIFRLFSFNIDFVYAMLAFVTPYKGVSFVVYFK